MKTHQDINRRRCRTERELAGEWRILRAKLRHVLDRTCALASEMVHDADDADAIDVARRCLLDYVDGRPFRVPPIEIADAIARLLEMDVERAYDRAA